MKKSKKDQPKEETPAEEQQPKVELLVPVAVEYCPNCGLPFEFCDWGDKPTTCRAWKEKNRPELIEKDESGNPVAPAVEKKEKGEEKAEKKEKNKLAYIGFDVKERMKKKYVTTIWGLHNFDLNAKDFSKKCSKKFACSCSVVDDDKIQIQGDISEFLYEFMESEYKIKQKYVLDAEEFDRKVKKQKEKDAQKQEEKKISATAAKQEEKPVEVTQKKE